MKIKKPMSEKIFSVFNIILMTIIILITIYPLVYVVFASFSDARQLLKHEGGLLLPLFPMTLEGYKLTLKNAFILSSFGNTVMYVVVGTAISLGLTMLGAFVVTRDHFYPRRFCMLAIIITMFFSGGIIPLFIILQMLNIYNTFWAMILPWAVSSFNLIIMKTFFEGIPKSLEESAILDGANDLRVLWSIFIPLSAPVIAVIALYYGVGLWNSWYPALVFMRDRELYPLQMILREVLILNTKTDMSSASAMVEESYNRELVKYCTIVVATVPILFVYPFLQRYFVQGVMIGAVKG